MQINHDVWRLLYTQLGAVIIMIGLVGCSSPAETMTEADIKILGTLVHETLPYADESFVYDGRVPLIEGRTLEDWNPNFQFIPVEKTILDEESPIFEQLYSPNEEWLALVACNLNSKLSCSQELFLQNSSANQMYHVVWDDQMSWRPIQDLTWLSETLFVFSHPANPNMARRYVLDVVQQEAIAEFGTVDKCFAEQRECLFFPHDNNSP